MYKLFVNQNFVVIIQKSYNQKLKTMIWLRKDHSFWGYVVFVFVNLLFYSSHLDVAQVQMLMPPFDKNTFIDLSVFYFKGFSLFLSKLNVISNYGTQERFFFVRIGRCSEIGSGELWMATEHGSSARSIHERISQINQRESERRRAQGIKINLYVNFMLK